MSHDDNDLTSARTTRARRWTRDGVGVLVVISERGTWAVLVPRQGCLRIGRGEACEVHIDDAKLSRQHATVTAHGEEIEITDLGSLNGTLLGDARLPPHDLVRWPPGESITLGSTVIMFQRAPAAPRSREVVTHGDFEARLQHACSSGHAFALLRMSLREPSARDETSRTESWEMVLTGWLSETDALGWYAPRELEMLLVDCTEAEALAREIDLRERLRVAELAVRLALVCCPRDGRTPEALIGKANDRIGAGQGETSVAGVLTTGALAAMERTVSRIARGEIAVLILGETGVGKEVLARRIHELSSRARMPLVSINCAALSESLLESELFGHERGAFTGAVQTKAGILESANGGTVLLDEVGELTSAIQAKLLRVIERREVTRVGGLVARPIDVRFVAATNRDLEVEVAAGRFRSDLYFRLNGATFTIPPLRERREEIKPLARLLLRQACERMGRRATVRIDGEAMSLLETYDWPGNIRELRNVIERAALLCTADVITVAHLPAEKLRRATGTATPSAAAANAREANDPERARIVDALERCGGNQREAAKALGISRGTLIKRIEAFGLRRPRKRDA
jgi:DNA-binding NtrC family response regulator